MIFIGPLHWRQIFDLDAERTLEALHDCLQLIFRGALTCWRDSLLSLSLLLPLPLTYTPLLFISRQPGTGLVH